MSPNEVTREIRRARFLAWWAKYDIFVYFIAVAIVGGIIGGFVMSFVDRAERMELTRRHDDELREFRMSCRRVVDERDNKVREATDAAASAATNAAKAAAVAAGATSEEVKALKPPVKRSPPVNLDEAVNRANQQIEGSK